MPKKVILYSDTPIFSGHEMQGALAIQAFVQDAAWTAAAFLDPGNEKFIRLIEEAPGDVELSLNKVSGVKGQSFRNHFMGRAIDEIAARMQAVGGDVVIALQGDIERCSLGVLAAKRAGIPVASYIPNPHSLKTMKARWGAIRDVFNRYLYNVPDLFIAASTAHADMLRDEGSRKPVEVIYNGMEVARFKDVPRARIEGLPEDKIILGHIGRLEFNQKRQDFLVRQMPMLKDRVHFLQIGDGDERAEFDALARALGVEDSITSIPFMNSRDVYASLDWLALPSGYEGMPLVMCEALLAGVPVMASHRDGMKDLLPASWCFTDDTFLETCKRLLDTDTAEELKAVQERIEAEMCVPHFHRRFLDVIGKLAAG